MGLFYLKLCMYCVTREENLENTEENEACPFFRHPQTAALNTVARAVHFSRDCFACFAGPGFYKARPVLSVGDRWRRGPCCTSSRARPWATHLTPLCSHLLISKMGVTWQRCPRVGGRSEGAGGLSRTAPGPAKSLAVFQWGPGSSLALADLSRWGGDRSQTSQTNE